MIDVIIPAYNAHKTIKETLYSLMLQTIKDKLKIYIVDDNSDTNYHELLEPFKDYLDITEYKLNKNSGPGAARNYGIKHSKSPYIMFIDSDDILYNHYSAETLFKTIDDKNCDLVISSFYEEVTFGNFIVHNGKKLWNHGKIYSRKFIEDNKITFNTTKTNEDLYFNFLLHLAKPRVVYINDTTYVWQCNSSSITRKNNGEYNRTALKNYNDNIYKVCMEAKKRKYKDSEIAKIFFFGLLQMYYTYLSFLTAKNNKDCKRLLKATKKNALMFEEYESKLSLKDKNSILGDELGKYVNSNLDIFFLPKITFYEFVEEAKKYE